MAGKELENRIFVGGLGWDVSERQLEDAFSRYGKIIDSQARLCGVDSVGGESALTAVRWLQVVNFREEDREIDKEGYRSVGCVEILSAGRVHLKRTKTTLLGVPGNGDWVSFIAATTLLGVPGNGDWVSFIAAFRNILIVMERDTGRPRGFGFLTFADRRGMEDAIREMHGREFGDRAITVNKAQPRMGGDDPGHGYSEGYSSGGRGSHGGVDRSPDSVGPAGHVDRFGGEIVTATSMIGMMEGAMGIWIVMNSRDKYGSRNRYVSDRYPPSGDRFGGDRYGGSDRYPQNGHGKETGYDRDGGPRGRGNRYGGGSGEPSRYEGRSYRDRPSGPYDRPRRGGGGRPSFDRY
ncbi:RNA-binding (RRM/RBD/RNP motifs) family protein with retrovirus zinc finger-like domain-containing protein [Actinidia rufa]|uniref:RNA-binding (RRM/RBD/RNP motifs) family protein with retrovirus zinc finger-like domain-containing protein n=1 Tax=Actinidia rufa TaxID=165716 RepID=A0A7J0GW03_9ERIC|nr:RNA-binding (RRM/RBD/RNP motifs) family protein with retrovirus zinc finger-like domain-containing protein [Actinidia rufa]